MIALPSSLPHSLPRQFYHLTYYVSFPSLPFSLLFPSFLTLLPPFPFLPYPPLPTLLPFHSQLFLSFIPFYYILFISCFRSSLFPYYNFNVENTRHFSQYFQTIKFCYYCFINSLIPHRFNYLILIITIILISILHILFSLFHL